MQPLSIIKVGGGIVEQADALHRLLDIFSSAADPRILVHGGGRSATQMAARLGIETQMVGGRRVTDDAMLRIVTMVYGGLVNKTLVAQLQRRGINALGLTGADCDLIRSHRRPPVCTAADGTMTDYGFVGDVDRCNGTFLSALIEQGITPVLAPLTHDGCGQMLNTNADTIASAAAVALAQVAEGEGRKYDVTLVYCFEKAGVLRDADDDESVIPHINKADFERLVADGTVQGGMIPKLQNALAACEAGVSRVVITHADHLNCPDRGTTITL
ncbi:MAG: acetylglutamate kinase [Prevotellaceae bacterium]|nr:acetylglutamate kinase [Prevotellaceae bacterium]